MSQPIDDKAFEEYLSRESQLSKRYRELGMDEAPAELDSLILARARDAVAAQPASSRKKPARMRWTPPLALAASMVLVISIVIESGTQHEVTTREMTATMPQSVPPLPAPTASDSSAKQESNALSAEPQPLSAVESDRSAAFAPEALQRQARKRADAAPDRDELKKSAIPAEAMVAEAPAPASEGRSGAIAPEMPPPASVSTVITAANVNSADVRGPEADKKAASLEEIAITANRARRTSGPGQGAGPRGTVTLPRAERPESDETLLQRARESDPRRWLEYIRELRRENKGTQADREWRGFIKAYPDYAVDEKDVARARQ